MYTVLKLLTVLPVSVATVERSSSTLRRLKTYLRNTTTRLNGLALLSIHRDIYVSDEEVLNKFLQQQEAKTKGKDWFNLPATKITDSVRHDLDLICMRSVLDTKRFYKKNETEAYPKYFQIGTVIDSPFECKTGRFTNKERKRTMINELLADAEFKQTTKKRYKNILMANLKVAGKIRKENRKMKKLKKKRK